MVQEGGNVRIWMNGTAFHTRERAVFRRFLSRTCVIVPRHDQEEHYFHFRDEKTVIKLFFKHGCQRHGLSGEGEVVPVL